MMRILTLLALAVLLLAACSEDDPAAPRKGFCGSITFDDVLPTDQDGDVTGTGGVGDWCWPDAGSDPAEPYLYPAFPNPFGLTTTSRVILPAAGDVLLRIVDADCVLVRTLHDGPRDAGPHDFVWDGRDETSARQPDGLYGVILTVGDFDCWGVVELRSAP